MIYTARYAHSESDTPGSLEIVAIDHDDAKRQARQFVADGYRNGTWINLDLGESSYAARNVNGKVVD